LVFECEDRPAGSEGFAPKQPAQQLHRFRTTGIEDIENFSEHPRMIRLQELHRDAWLAGVVHGLRQIFAESGVCLPIPDVSWGATNRATELRGTSICVSSLLKPIPALLALHHEFVHVASGDAGHGAKFQEISSRIGLRSPLLSYPSVNKLVRGRLGSLVGELRPLDPVSLDSFSPYRWVRVACGDCGLVARAPERALRAFGAPLCSCNQYPMYIRGRCERSRVTYPILDETSESIGAR
jgi:hypothetical protein